MIGTLVLAVTVLAVDPPPSAQAAAALEIQKAIYTRKVEQPAVDSPTESWISQQPVQAGGSYNIQSGYGYTQPVRRGILRGRLFRGGLRSSGGC